MNADPAQATASKGIAIGGRKSIYYYHRGYIYNPVTIVIEVKKGEDI